MPADEGPIALLATLGQDETRGAGEIAHEARSALAHLATMEAPDPDRVERQARQAVLALLAAHPAMAPLIHLANQTLHRLDERGLPGLAELEHSPPVPQQVAHHAAEAIGEAATLVTYSRSGTVLATIRRALDDAPRHVITSEARPGDEGLSVARELEAAGADVEFTYDVALPDRVSQADAVLVGADAITQHAFLNKTGTRLLLQRARETQTPSLVLASSDKLWPTALPHGPEIDVQADWRPDVPAAVDVSAPLFEQVPLGLADRIVTDQGPCDPADVADEADERELHPEVHAAVDRG